MKMKIVALLMAAAITTGVGGYGTYAYFTDQDSLANDVSITMGKVDVEAYWKADEGNNTWKLTSAATEAVAVDGGETLSFENVKPGDTFERTIVIANYGTLKADTTVQLALTELEGLKVEMVNPASQTGSVQWDPNVENRVYENAIIPYGWIEVTIKVTVPETVDNSWMEKVINASATEFVTVGAHQTIY